MEPALSERRRVRQEKAVPVLEKLKEWIEVHKELVLPQSPIGVAMKYMSERWGAFLEYTR
ncbi:MAG TPA: IS66 family transposase, partial [Planctomycetes bacterium]|nr:IS66 family transposase [Planctomycetota bacterium]